MGNFYQIIESAVLRRGNNICLGMDPILSKIPGDATPEQNVLNFYTRMLERMEKAGVLPAVVKPNVAYFEAISVEAQEVLLQIILLCKQLELPVILDAKRGDIGRSSGAYAQAAFTTFAADAVTVSPYMGEDSVMPFVEFSQAKGVYALLRTSNRGARDIQDAVLADGKPLYMHTAQKLLAWNPGNLGAVVGATSPAELEVITHWFCTQGQEIPFLIPGVSVPGVEGGQGGSLKDVLKALKNAGSTRNFHVVNSSSGINYAYINKPDYSPADAALWALEALVGEYSGNLT
jgi:orotidine-5'-phosphate decarboxylase